MKPRLTISPVANTPTVTTANGFYKHQPRISSFDLARGGATIPTNFFTGTARQTKDAPGPLDITNGFSIALSANGSPLILRMLTQDLNPSWTVWGGTGNTFPTAVNVVGSTSRLSDTLAITNHTAIPSTWDSPVQLNVTISDAAALPTRGRILFEGTDSNDDPISETLAWTNPIPSGGRTACSTLWYKTVSRVRTAGWTTGSTSTFGVTAQDTSTRTLFTPQDDDLVAFWTVEGTKGITPNVYDGIIVENATMDIARDSLMEFACTALGREGRLYTNLSGATYSQNQTAGSTNRATRSNIMRSGANAILPASADVFSGWQTQITGANDVTLAASDTTLTLNQELDYTNTLGDRFQATKPGRTGQRLLQLECSTVYARENNYSEYFEGNQNLQNVQIKWQQTGLGAYPYELILEVPEMQLTADPDPPVTDQGIIYQNVVMKAVEPKNINVTPYDYRFIARYSDYTPVRTYTI